MTLGDEEVVEQNYNGSVFNRVLVNVILVLLNIGYSCFGGFIYRLIEIPAEIEACRETQVAFGEFLNDTALELFHLRINETIPDDTRKVMLWASVNEFREIIQTDKSLDFWGNLNTECALQETVWSWSNSILFAMTIITSIGYGHIAPQTYLGRMILFPYSLCGIPLMLACLANIVRSLQYSLNCCCGCCGPREKELDRARALKVDRLVQKNLAKEGIVFKRQNVVTNTTSSKEPASAGHGSGPGPNGQRAQDVSLMNDDDFVKHDSPSVPLSISIGAMVIYILLGAIIFNITDNWAFSDAAYFCFITVSTIGFGDMVPGIETVNAKSIMQLGICCAYMLIGLALISMCFTLIQEEATAKAEYFADLFGLNTSDSEDENDEADYASEDDDDDDDERAVSAREQRRREVPESARSSSTMKLNARSSSTRADNRSQPPVHDGYDDVSDADDL